MSREKKRALAVGLALLLALGVSLAALAMRRSVRCPVARITLDGEVIAQLDLNGLTERWTRTVTGESGISNTIVAEDGAIWVESADCPDQICVRHGPISHGPTPIVCLPNHLIIEIVEGGSDIDAAAG